MNWKHFEDVEAAARVQLSPAAHDVIANGAEAERTVAANRRAFDGWAFVPRIGVDVASVDTSVQLLGETLPHPVLLAPAGGQGQFHPEGECAAARGAAAAGAVFCLSTFSTCSLEEVAAAAGPKWFQMYLVRDRELIADVVRSAEASGYQAIVLTMDVPIVGRRWRGAPIGVASNLFDGNFRGRRAGQSHPLRDLVGPTWTDLEWLQSLTSLPVVVKGVLAPDDARQAIALGARALIVSNHGGRQLDGAVASLTMLPAIAAVAGEVPVLVDGGVRRGIDVLLACALGATAVMIGRPYLYGLAAAGADGVQAVVELLRDEIVAALKLAGCPSLRAVDRRLVLSLEEQAAIGAGGGGLAEAAIARAGQR